MKKIIFLGIGLINLLIHDVYSQQYFPGGVVGAEAWYSIDYQDLQANIFPNDAVPHIRISLCGDRINGSLFNFNHSGQTDSLCLAYNAPLEISNSRNIFFVGETERSDVNFSHTTTDWHPSLIQDSIIRNQFNTANKYSNVNKRYLSYESDGTAYINFYNWNVYQTDKKFKSFGFRGETAFYIGKGFVSNGTENNSFAGNFAEFISFPFELTANQKIRIESYLALKYGITLNQNESYRDSRNAVFWNSANNSLFGKRIFGIGRDNVSGLNQLQSESVHNKDFLIAAVGNIATTNVIKQQNTFIKNYRFTVFGDNNGEISLGPQNINAMKVLNRKWLAQNTPPNNDSIPIVFKLNVTGTISDFLTSNPDLKLWLLHDRYTTNLEISDFANQYVDYYEPSINESYAVYKDIYFDTDQNIYDQFTFAAGPKMIVQIRYELGSCNTNSINAHVVITGGTAPYKISIFKDGVLVSNTQGINTGTFGFVADVPGTYMATVTDSYSLIPVTTTVEITPYIIDVDLGPDTFLTNQNPSVTLNAGVNVSDPEASYLWYRNGTLIEHFSPVYIASTPGEYKVIVTSGNRICQEEDTIIIKHRLSGTVTPGYECDNIYGSISLLLEDGIPNYTTTITGNGINITQVHNTQNFEFNNLPFGIYTVKTIDNVGQVYEEEVRIEDPLYEMDLNIVTQLLAACSVVDNPEAEYITFSCANTFTLDASVGNNNVTYEWFENGISTNIYSPVVELYQSDEPPVGDPNEVKVFTVIVTNTINGCTTTETFSITRQWSIREITQAFKHSSSDNIADNNQINNPAIKTKVYPNPSDSGATFYYEAHSQNKFDGIVEIFNTTGALLNQVKINGESNYVLPFHLLTSGTYFIRTTVNEKIITNKIIIK